MGRKNKSKKRTVEKELPPPKPPNRKIKEIDGSTRTYLKVKAVFKCSKDNCSKKPWESFHAWAQDEKIFCDFCGGRAEIDDFKDEMCKLANYYCGTPTCQQNQNHWQSIHGGVDRTEYCDICNASVAPNGIQERFGRHFWFLCISQGCGASWEDFSLIPQRTQRCSACGSRGDIIGTKKIRVNPEDKRGGWSGGSHNWQNCDMCQDLKGQGKAISCIKYREVQCKVKKLAEGFYMEKIIKIR